MDIRPDRRWRRAWPWLVLALVVVPAAWHVLDFEEDRDNEFPNVQRPTFNPFPPSAYRLAEPGDTIDRVAIYMSSAACVLAAWGWISARRSGQPATLWPAATGLSVAMFWHASTPGPTFDGWHGLGWRAIFHPSAPPILRAGLAIVALGLTLIIGRAVQLAWPRRAHLWHQARTRNYGELLVAAALLVLLRQGEVPAVFGPPGYWPRWAFDWGVLAFALALLRAVPGWPARWPGRTGLALGCVLAWTVLVFGGIEVTWCHRPLERLRTIVPGKIYISAMPTPRGLAIAHSRHRFKTIINLFPEDTDERSPLWADELKFVAQHGIRYIRSPTGALRADAFLDRTLATARDPDAWPILVHCHGCMDRSPAWMGIYRFVVEGWPLVQALREIEQHRGYRPKASVFLLYNRVLRPRAPEHFAQDPTAQKLKDLTAGTRDPFYDQLRLEREQAAGRLAEAGRR
jgi:hypothetical protein